jgi:DNA-binding XRE family transcriptional regulator
MYRKYNKDRQCTYNVTLGRIRVTIFAVEKQKVLHSLCVCVFVALLIQQAKRMRRIILACPAQSRSFTLCNKRHE